MDKELFEQYHRQMLVIDGLLELYAPERVWGGIGDDAVICTIHRLKDQITLTLRANNIIIGLESEVIASETNNLNEAMLLLGQSLERTK